MGGDAEVLTKIPQGTSSHEWAPVGNKLLLVITDPKPEELTADKEDDKSKTFVIDRRQFKQDYVAILTDTESIYTLVPGDSIPTQLGAIDDSGKRTKTPTTFLSR
jgi:hypothetical protein